MAIAGPDMGAVNPEGIAPKNNLPQNEIAPIVAKTQRELEDLQNQFYPVKVNWRIELMNLEYIWEHPDLGSIWKGGNWMLVYQDPDWTLKAVTVAMTNEEKMEFWRQVEANSELKELVYQKWWYLEVMPSYLWNQLLSVKDTFESLTWEKLPKTVFDDIINWISRAKIWKSIEKEPTKVEIDLLKLPYPFQQQLIELLQRIDNSNLDEETKKLSKAVAFVAALTIVDPNREEKLISLYDEQTAKEVSFRFKTFQKIQHSDLPERIKKTLVEFLSEPQKWLQIDDTLYNKLTETASTHYNDEIWAVAALVIVSSPEYSKQVLEKIKSTLQKSLPNEIVNKIYNNNELTAQEFAQALKIIVDQHPEILFLTYVILTNQPAVAEQVSWDKLLEFIASLLWFGKDPQRAFPSHLKNLDSSEAWGNNPSLVETFALQVLHALEQNEDKIQQEAEKAKQEAEKAKQEALQSVLEAHQKELNLLFTLPLPDQFRIDILTQTNKKEAINLLLEAFHQKYPFLDIKTIYNSGALQWIIELLYYKEQSTVYKQLKEKHPDITLKEVSDFLMKHLREAIKKYSTKSLSTAEIEQIRIDLIYLSGLIWGIELNEKALFYRIAKKIVETPQKFDPKVVEIAKEFLANYDKKAQYLPPVLKIALNVIANPSNDPKAKEMAVNAIRQFIAA